MIARRSLLAGGLALAALPVRGALAEPRMMEPGEAHRLAASGEIVLVDVRSPAEWAETGSPQGAERVWIRDPDLAAKLERLTGGDRDRPVALICATGIRSSFVANALVGAGYTDVRNVGEGMLGSAAGPGWLRRGLPTER